MHMHRAVAWSCDQKVFAPQELDNFFCTFVVAPRTTVKSFKGQFLTNDFIYIFEIRLFCIDFYGAWQLFAMRH